MAEKTFKFRVETDKGPFMVELDRAPTDPTELNNSISEALSAGGVRLPEPSQGFTPGTPEAAIQFHTQFEQSIRKAAPYALPVAAAIGAPIIGGATGLGTLGMGLLESGLQSGAELANQQMGLTAPSDVQVGLAAGVPLAARGLSTIGPPLRRYIATKLPGAGVALRQHGVQTAETLAKGLSPPIPSEQLYSIVDQMNPQVDLTPIKGTLDKLLKEESLATEGLKIPTTVSVAGGLKKEFFTPKGLENLPEVQQGYIRVYHGEGGPEAGGAGGLFFTSNPKRAAAFGPTASYVDIPQNTAQSAQIAALKAGSGTPTDYLLSPDIARTAKPTQISPEIFQLGSQTEQGLTDFQRTRLLMRRINDKIGSLKAQGGEGLGDMLQVKKSFAQALDKTANPSVGPAYAALKEANTAFRQEIAADTVTDLVKKNITQLEGRDAVNISAGRAMKQLQEATRKDKFLKESFAPGTLENVLNGLDQIRQLPVPGAPPGAEAGSKLMLRRSTVGGALGAAIGYEMGIPQAIAVPTGALAGIGTAELMSHFLATPTGTNILLHFMSAPGGLTGSRLTMLATLARLGTITPTQTQTPKAESRIPGLGRGIDIPLSVGQQ